MEHVLQSSLCPLLDHSYKSDTLAWKCMPLLESQTLLGLGILSEFLDQRRGQG